MVIPDIHPAYISPSATHMTGPITVMTGIGHCSRSTNIFSHFPRLLPLFHERRDPSQDPSVFRDVAHTASSQFQSPGFSGSWTYLCGGVAITKILVLRLAICHDARTADLRRGYSDPCVVVPCSPCVPCRLGWLELFVTALERCRS